MVIDLEAPNYANFSIKSESKLLDLRKWKDTSDNDESPSIVELHRVVELVKVNNSEKIHFQFSTSGDEMSFFVEHFPFSVIQKQPNPTESGTRLQKTYQVVVDISDIKLNDLFKINILAKYKNSFQKSLDFAMSVRSQLKFASLALWFPKDKGYSSINFFKGISGHPESKEKWDESNGKIVTDNGRNQLIHWNVIQPKDKEIYWLEWTW